MNKLRQKNTEKGHILLFLVFLRSFLQDIQKKLFANGKNMCILAIATYFQYFFEFSKLYEQFYTQKMI